MEQIIQYLLNNPLQLLGGVISFSFIAQNLNSYISNKISLKRKNQFYSNIFKNIEFNDIDNEDINFDKTFSNLFYKFKSYVKKSDLVLLYRNISSLTIDSFNCCDLGYYDCKSNSINFVNNNILKHEFIHMASSYYDFSNDIVMSGLSRSTPNIRVGIGLTEGYVEVLANRIFNKSIEHTDIKQLIRFAYMFEKFFSDKSEMEHLFFTCNLQGFINYFCSFASRNEIMSILHDIDYVFDSLKSGSSFYSYYKSIMIELKLFSWFYNKYDDCKKTREFLDLLFENKMIKLIFSDKQNLLKKVK